MATAKDEKKISGVTSTGFKFSIPKEALDDWELLENLSRLDNGEYGAIVPTMNELLGPDQFKKLKEHLRDKKTGRVSVNAMMNEMNDIFSASGDKAKNS